MHRKRGKRILAWILSFSMLLGLTVTPVSATEVTGNGMAIENDTGVTADAEIDLASDSDADEAKADTEEETEAEVDKASGSDADGVDAEAEVDLIDDLEKASDSDADEELEEEESAVGELQALIDALPTVDEVSAMSTEEQNEVYTLVSEIWDAYYELTEAEQAQVDTTALEELSDYFNGLTALTDAFPTSGTLATGEYALTGDVTLTGVLVISSEVTVDLAGHKLTGSGSSNVFRVSEGGALTLEDSGSDGTVDGNGKVAVSLSLDDVAASFTMNGGTITGCSGGAVSLGGYVAKASFTMNGGTITGNASTSNNEGGAVYMWENAEFTMNGGSITDNTSESNVGGAVYMDGSSCSFTMNDGKISGNKALEAGGGIYINNGSFTMAGGTLTDNMVLSSTSLTYDKAGDIALSSSSNASAVITGGIVSADCLEYVAEEVGYSENNDGTYTVGKASTTVYVAAIGDTQYESIAAALAVVQANETVKLLTNITTDVELNTDSAYTFDLNGYTITGELSISAGADVTVTNGTLKNEGGKALNVVASGESNNPTTVTVDSSVTITNCAYGIYISPSETDGCDGTGVSVTLNGTIDTFSVAGIYVDDGITSSGEDDWITVNGTIRNDSGVGIAITGAEQVVVNESAKVSGGTAIEVRAGGLVVEGGTITSSEGTSLGSNGTGTVSSGYGIAIVQNSNALPISVTVNGGTITGVAAVYEKQVVSGADTDKISVSLTGGTYASHYDCFDPEAHGEDAYPVVISEKLTGFITGGSYLSDVSAYLADGYTISGRETQSDRYVVSESSYIATVTDSNGEVTYYATLAEAAEYANSLATGNSRITTTITLTDNITLTETVALKNSATTVGDYLILDLDDHVITSDVANGYALYIGSSGTYGKVTVQNGTINATANAYGAIEIKNEAAILTSLTLSSQTAGHGTVLVDSLYSAYAAFTDLTITTTDGYCLEVAESGSGNLSLSGTNTYTQTASANTSSVNACVYMGGNSVKITVGSSGEVQFSSDGYGAYITGSNRLVLEGSGSIAGTAKGVYVDSSYVGSYSALEVSATSTIAVDGGVSSDAANYTNGAVSISGGNYEFELDDSYVASGYKCVLDSDAGSSTYGRYIIEEVYVAEVYNSSGNPTGSYNTLSGAVSAAETGYTIKLIANCTGSSYITITKNLTIDLNGYTYTSTTTSSNGALYFSNTTIAYTLTVTDNSESGGGAIVCTGVPSTDPVSGVYLRVGKLVVTGNASIACTNGFGVYVGGYTSAYSSAKAPTVTIEDNAKIDGGVAGIAIYGDKKGTSSYGPVVNVDGGSVTGGWYGIAGNGSTSYPGATFINVSGGTVSGTDESDSTGIYHPQVGTVTVSGGTVSGYSAGIEMRAGTLNVSGGTIKATAESGTYTFNGSGTTIVGAGVGISQHSTDNEIAVDITGGEISGYYGIYEVNTYAGTNSSNVAINVSEEDESVPTVVKSTVTDGKAIYSESISGETTAASEITSIAISGGHFSSDLADTPSYIADGYTAYTEDESTEYYTNGIPYTVKEATTVTVYYGENAYELNSGECYDLTQAYDEEAGYGIPSGYLYAGLFSDAVYTSVATGCGNGVDFTPVAGETYYVKTVSDSYFQIKCLYSYVDNQITSLWPILGIDAANYASYGFVIDGSEKVLESSNTAYETVTIELEGYDSTSMTCNKAFGVDGFVGVLKLERDTLSGYADENGTIELTMQPYFVTLDGVMVTGVISRTVTFENGYAGAGFSGYKDTTVTSTTKEYKESGSSEDGDGNTEVATAEAVGSQTTDLRTASAGAVSRSALNVARVMSTANGAAAGATAAAASGSGSGTSALPGGLIIENEYVINEISNEAQLTHGELSKLCTTLEEAIAAAVSGDVITLLSNVTVEDLIEIKSSQDITLNLSTYTISGATSTRLFAVSGALTIEADDGGKIENTGSSNAISNGGTLVIESGEITASSAYAIYNTGTLTVNGGTVTGGSSGTGYALYLAGGTTTINGGTLTGTNTSVGAVRNNSTLIINDGTVGNTTGDIYGVYNAGTVTVNGGTLSGSTAGLINTTSDSMVTVNDGILQGGKRGLYNSTGTAEIYGGTFTGTEYGLMTNSPETNPSIVYAGTFHGGSCAIIGYREDTIAAGSGFTSGSYNQTDCVVDVVSFTLLLVDPVNGGSEAARVPIDSSTATYDLTQYVPTGYLYGGLYTDRECTNAVDSADNCGAAFTYDANDETTYYVKLVDDAYFRVKCLYSYIDNNINSLWPIIGIDSDSYYKYGFLIDGEEVDVEQDEGNSNAVSGNTNTAYQSITINLDGYNGTTMTCGEAFEVEGYLGVLKMDANFLEAYADEKTGTISFTMTPFFVTTDGVMVTGVVERTVTFEKGQVGAGFSGFDDEIVGSVTDIYSETGEFTYLDYGVSVASLELTASYVVEDDTDTEEETVIYTITKYDGTETTTQQAVAGASDVTVTYAGQDGSIFAGWYTDADYTTAADFSEVNGDMTVYAKYVSADYLTAKTATLTTKGAVSGVRAVAAVDSRNYSEVGFDYEFSDGTETSVTVTKYSTTVSGSTAKKLYGGDVTSAAKLIYNDLSLGNVEAGTQITVTPYWVTPDGTRVTGTSKTVTYTGNGLE